MLGMRCLFLFGIMTACISTEAEPPDGYIEKCCFYYPHEDAIESCMLDWLYEYGGDDPCAYLTCRNPIYWSGRICKMEE